MMSSISRSNNYEVTTELTWENGQLSLHGLSGISANNPPQPKPATWSTKPGDSTLESLVHQATTFNNNNFPQINNLTKYSTPLMPTNNNSIPSAQNWLPQNSHMHMEQINPECSLAESSEKWRDNSSTSSHMQVEQNHEGLQVKVQASSMAMVPPAGGKWRDQNLQVLDEKEGVKKMSSCSSRSLLSKRVRSETEQYCNNINCDQEGSEDQPSACASASATFCRDRDTTMMTWASFESPPQSFKTARNNTDDDSAGQECSENQDGERMTKGESFRSQSSARRSRAAAIHNQSERRRRDRINEKMKALQRLVPNASKTDKASMLDEVIEYLKQLQAQVQMMSNARNMPPQMVMPMGMQQQLQMSLLARMGMGMGMGMTPMGMGMAGMNMNMNMIDANNLARNLQPHSLMQAAAAAASLSGSAPSFVPPQFTMQAPATIPTPTQLKPNVDAANMNNSALPNFNNAYHTFLAQQSMNMDFFNKVAALCRQQGNQASNKQGNLSQLPSDGTQRE